MKKTRSAVTVLVRKNGTLLLQHRTDDAPEAPGEWSFFGGALEKGETFRAAAIRELQEELEYTTTKLHLIYTYKKKNNNHDAIARLYYTRYDEKQKLVLHEGQGMKWLHISDAVKLPMHPAFRKALRTLAKLI